jgi:hypothetical protein
MSSAHLESCIHALEAIAEAPSHATLQPDVHYTVRTALRELDESDRAALRSWAEAGLRKEHGRISRLLAVFEETLEVLDTLAPDDDIGDH